ncbi:MAG: SLBB domain-containing protein, partial [Chitinophagaceae bacterium]
QPPVNGGDAPAIDPAQVLKDASPSDLQRYLRDGNQSKAGIDLNSKNLNTLKNDGKISRDSNQRDDYRTRLYDPEMVYGSHLFRDKAIMELAELSTPPLDYPIGVGDQIIVSLWGGADTELSYIVARDGSIFPQGLGKITVQGLTYETARSVIHDRFRRVVPPSTNIAVSLGQPRSIVVNVTGEVNDAGPVVVSAFTNALNVVALAGGVNQFGNLRGIYIKRNGRLIDSVDVYKYLTQGDFGKHRYLDNNDNVIVSFYDKKVLASGQFRRPMYYQLKKEEGFRDLLKYSGGLLADAYRSSAVIIRNVEEKQTIKNVNLNVIGLKANGILIDEELYDGDVVVVNQINPGLSNKVIVKGEVAYPNVYELRKGDRLFDIINRAGGITPFAFVERAYIYKGAGDSANNIRSEKIDVNLSDLNKNIVSSQNVPIGPNDIIEIFNKFQFSDKQFVSIEGEVRSPKSIQLYGGMTLKDLIYLANGIKPSAEFGKVEVTSIVNIDPTKNSLKPTKTVVTTYNVMPNLELDSISEKVFIKPYDQVYVRKNPDFELQQNITLEGLIKYPGPYARLNKNERLSSYIDRAGGVNENANIGGTMLLRRKNAGTRNAFARINETTYTRDSMGKIIDSIVGKPEDAISIDLYKALKYKNSKYDLVLQDGDVIFVPEVNPVVTIRGAVQAQLKIYFDKEHTNLSYYIDKAGGLGIRPWRKRIYVTYPNGRSSRTKTFLFFHFFPKVEEGSTIFVPFKPEGKGFSDFAGQLLISAVPIIAAAIIAKNL